MKLETNNKTKLCTKYYKRYPDVQINSKYKVIEIEYCDYSCAKFINDISQLAPIEMEKYLDIFFFQIIYTIMAVQKVYPYFVHNDLFMRNILGLREKDNGNYYVYEFDNLTYNIPQKKFYPKINDFGLTNLDHNYANTKLYKSKYKDIYNIIFDVYNGGNIGSTSLTELCKDNKDKLDFLKLYFANYFNVSVVDTYVANNRDQMNWNWNNILEEDFLESIEMVDPKVLLRDYFYKIFKKISSEV
jgi:hypothetical protein